jgi:hypothetical protein
MAVAAIATATPPPAASLDVEFIWILIGGAGPAAGVTPRSDQHCAVNCRLQSLIFVDFFRHYGMISGILNKHQ